MSTPGFNSWQEYLGTAGGPAQSGAVSGPVQTFTSWQEYQQAGQASPLAPATTVWDRLKLKPSQLPDDHARRMKAAAGFAPDSAERLMAIADMAVVGFPTFGEETYSYPGRELLREVVRYRGNYLDVGLPDAIRKAAAKLGQEPSIVEARMQTLGLLEREAITAQNMSGRVFTDILGFAYAEQVLPIARQGALMAVQRLQGTYDPATFDDGVSEMEQRIASDGNQRALQMAANLGLYILPLGPKTGPLKILSGRPQAGVGASPLQNPNIFGGVEAVRFMGRIAEEGFGGAIVGELQDMGNAINPFAADLAPSERVARVALAAMAVAGLTSGAADVRKVAREVTQEVASAAPGRLGASLQTRLRASALADVMEDALSRSEIQMPDMPAASVTGAASVPRMVQFETLSPEDHSKLARNFDLAMADMPARDLVAWSNLSGQFAPLNKEATPGVQVLRVGEEAPMRLPEQAADGSPVQVLRVEGGKPKNLADAAADAERRLAESGLAANENYIYLDELKAETAHLPRLNTARTINNAEDMRQVLVDSWGLGAKEAKATAQLFEARAQAWAEETGRPASEWYTTRLASVGKEGDAPGRADEIIIEGATVRYKDFDGKLKQGQIGPNPTGALGRYGRVPIVREDGAVIPTPLASITEGIPDTVRVRYAHIESGQVLYQSEGAGVGISAVHHTSADSLPALATLGRVEKAKLDAPSPSQQNYDFGVLPRWSRDTALIFDPEATITKGPKTLIAADVVQRGDGETSYRFDPTEAGAVATREIRAIVVPESRRADVPPQLIEDGARVYGYDPATPGDRQRVVAQAEEEVNALYQREQNAKAAIYFDRTGKAILRAMKNPDPSTAIHELAHILRRDAYRDGGVTAAEQAALEKWAGVKDGRWTVDAEEKFARGFERYVRDGKAPTRELRGLFSRLAKMLKEVYQNITGSAIDIEVSPEVREVFDNLLGKRAGDERARLAALEEAAEIELARQRDELLSIMPDDPRIDLDSPKDVQDEALIAAIRRQFGAGEEDFRTPAEILDDAQTAAVYADYQRLANEDYRANFYAEALEAQNFVSKWASVRWYKLPDGKFRSDARHTIYSVDQRQIPEHIREAVTDWVARFYNDPEYYGDPGNTSGKGQPVRPRRMSEIVSEGEDIPFPVYEAWLESMKPMDYDEPLYQSASPNEIWQQQLDKYVESDPDVQAVERTIKLVKEWRKDERMRQSDGEWIFNDGDADRGYARYINANFDLLPPDLQEWWMRRPDYLDAEDSRGTYVSTTEEGGIRGTHVYNAMALAENRMEALEAQHRAAVVEAFFDGKPVPDHVLKDYPDLLASEEYQTRAKPLYQSAGPNEKDLALVAAKRIGEGMAEETVLRMLQRDFKVKPGRANVVYRRALEQLARPDIDRVYRETESRAAVAEMLAENHPRIAKSRYAAVIRETLFEVGEGELQQIRQAVSEAFERELPTRAAPVTEAILQGNWDKVEELAGAGNPSGQQKRRIIQTAREQAAAELAPVEWQAIPNLDHMASVLATRLNVSERQAMELGRAALDQAGVDYTAEIRRQTQEWLATSLEPAAELVWSQMRQGYTFDEAFENGRFGRAAGREAVRAKITERQAYDRIAEVYEETSSYGAVRELLQQEYPSIPAARYKDIFSEALKASGIEVATAPRRKYNPKTKRREIVEGGRRVVVIGSNEIVVPAAIVKDIQQFKDRHPVDGGSLWTEARYVERMTDRNQAAYKWLVEHREAAVTAWTKDMVRWNEEIKAVYGKYLDDKKFRQLVMDWAENKMERGDGLLTEGIYFGDRLLEDVRTIIRNQNPDIWQDVERVAEWHRATYDLLLDRQNEVRRAYGMGEIPRRNDYMAHIQEEATALQKILQLQDYSGPWIPSSARRNTPYNAHAKQRLGQRSRRDSLANTEDYIDSAMRTIHFTEAAIRRRTLVKVLMESEHAESLGRVIQYWQNQASELVRQPVEGSDWVPRLFNSRIADGALEAVRWIAQRTALNGLVGNLRTAVMQTGSLPQVTVIAGRRNVAAAAVARIHIARGLTPDPVEASAFMTRRYAYRGRAARTKWDKAIEIGAKPMEIIETAVAQTVWQAFHIQATNVGKSFDEAVKYADKMAERTLAGRAIGEKPAVFNTDFGRVLLQFQLEVNNMLLLARHDAKWNELLGREATPAERWQRAANYAVYAWIANSIYEMAFSDRPLPDPIELAFDLNGIAATDDEKVTGKIFGRVLGEIVSTLPGGTLLTGAVLDESQEVLGLGLTRDEFLGRTPAGMYAGTLPSTSALRNALKGSTPSELGWNLTTTLGLPFGGRQLNKTATAAEALADGGTVRDRQGRERFKIEGLEEEARALLFGPNATKAARRYYDKKAGG
nr:hypothetical protein [Fimbriimonadaceae bacterium]